MQTLAEKVLELRPPGGMFDDTVVTNLFPDHTQGARLALVHRAVQSREVLRLKRGLYCLAPHLRSTQPHPFMIAGMLHAPSQISLETALSHHGLIPEAVQQVASVTSQRSRTFVTPLGRFEFVRVPCNALRAGVGVERVDRNLWAYVSSPLRAIADLVYTRREVSWKQDGLEFLVDSLRIERGDLLALSMERFDEIHDSIRNKRTRQFLQGMRRELSR
jgi:hypothetical protein